MTFYLLFFFLVTLFLRLSYVYHKKSILFQIGTLLLAIAVSGCRDYIGEDFRSYVTWYELKNRDYDFEFGFVWIMNLFRGMHSSYHVLFFFLSFCTIFLVFLGIKKYTAHTGLAFFFFLLIPFFYLHSWSLIRQSLAMSIVFYAFHYLITKKYLTYTLLMGVAMSIHITSLIPFLVFIGVYKWADKVKIIHITIALFLSLILSQIPWIHFFSDCFKGTRYFDYFSDNLQPSTAIKIIVLNGLALFILFFYQKMKSVYPNQKYFMLLFFSSVIITNIFASINNLTRFAYYFYIFEIVVFADLVLLEWKNRGALIFYGLYFYGITSFIYSLKIDYHLNDQNTKYIPYNSVFYKFDDPFFMMGTDYIIDYQMPVTEKR